MPLARKRQFEFASCRWNHFVQGIDRVSSDPAMVLQASETGRKDGKFAVVGV